MFSLFKKQKPIRFLSAQQQEEVVSAIRSAEKSTSGEIRVFIENKCRFVDPIDRAYEVFGGLQMEKTEQRNAVLVYIAVKHRQLAIYGDEGIHAKLGQAFWDGEVRQMLASFNKEDYAQGLIAIIRDVGAALSEQFPYNPDTDKNELPDDLVFGR
ncbi:MAG: TPM domain-containing protein [Chitinophagaceae bacterium]